VEPLSQGLWWYQPKRDALRLVRDRDLDISSMFLSHPTTDPLISYGHPIVFISADIERQSRKYSNRAYRLSLIEAGAAMQNAYLVGAQLDLPVRACAGIVEDVVDPFLELPSGKHALLAILIGN
jgi:SagB-type dehydrogenase family enzyme